MHLLKLYQQNIYMRRTIILVAIILAASAIQIDTYFDADPQQCIEQKCPNQWAACQKDPKCVPALQDCEKKCGTKTSCWTLCLPGKGSQAAIDVAKCAQANGCVGMIPSTAVAIATPQQCIEQHCRDQLHSCQRDPKCFAALQDCEKECGNTTSCYSTCLAKKGNTNASNLWKCIIDNNCLDAVETTAVAIVGDIMQCVKQKCPNEYAACQKDPKCVPTLEDCQKKCGTKASCWTFCLAGKDSAAINVAKCAQAKGCVGVVPSILSMGQQVSIFTGPEECVMQYCKKEEQACVNDRRCIMVMDECDNQCNTNFTCWNNCLSRRGNKNASDYFKCIVDHECYKVAKITTAVAVADPQKCIEDKCPTQWAACQKDSKCIPALQDCQKKCGTKESCWALCLPGKGSQAAIDVAKCAQANGCVAKIPQTSVAEVKVDPQQCIEQKCPNQWAACQKDPKCVPALQDCEKKCGTKASCWSLCLPGKGSQAAIDVAKCAQANGCAGTVPSIEETRIALATPQECIEQHCRQQLGDCVKDPKCFPALQDCEKECQNNTSCFTTCLSKKGNTNAVNFWKCLLDNNCLDAVESTAVATLGDPQQCIEQKCPNQWAACQKDPKCIPALQDCEKKCGTKTSCWTLCLPGKGSQAAIDVAKCAQANGCVGMVPAFESCMIGSCAKQHAECLSNQPCRQSLRKCRNPKEEYDFDVECLLSESAEGHFVSEWYHCAGGHFCL